MKSTIKTIYIVLDQPLAHHELHAFSAHFSALHGLPQNRDDKGKNIYGESFPQFRVHNDNAAIFATNDNATAIEKLAKKNVLSFNSIEINNEFALNKLPGSGNMNFYRLYRWIPMDERYFPNQKKEKTPELYLNGSNGLQNGIHTVLNESVVTHIEPTEKANTPKPWNNMFMDEKVKSLEKILVSNIIEFAQASEWQISKNKSLRVQLHDIHHINKVKLYDIEVLAFDITYASNVSLPDHLGLGRGKSLGFGWQLLSKHNDEMSRIFSTAKTNIAVVKVL